MTGKTQTRPWKRKRKLRTQDVCARYNISSKTVDRWVETGILSKPMYINGIRYFDEDELDQRDQERMTGDAPSAA
jgi:DNA-binding transcriptional MerR regulator